MKKLVYSTFIAFWAAIGTLVLVNALGTDGTQVDPPEASEPVRYSLSDVARHDTPEDCWMAIEGKVYDVSGYVPRHPAPLDVIEPWCGREATEGMRTKGDGNDHSARAWRMLARHEIGNLQ